MRIRELDYVGVLLMMVALAVSLSGIMITEGVSQRPFILLTIVNVVVMFYLAFRVEIGKWLYAKFKSL